MPGMNSGLSPGDPTLVAAFRSALLHQGAIALLMLVLVGLLWGTARAWRFAPFAGAGGATWAAEPRRGGCSAPGSGCCRYSAGLALPTGGQVRVLALTAVQQITVPVQYGSSG